MVIGTEDGYWGAGGAQFPLNSSISNSLLKDADPALYYLLDYFAGVINIHVGARWNAEVAAIGRSDLNNLPVGHKIHFDPMPYLQEDQFKFPLLAAFRKNEKYEWWTANWYRITCTLNIMWIMPPVNAGQAERLMPFRSAVAKTLMDRTAMGFDSFYNGGEKVWTEAGLDKIGIKTCSFGNIPTDTNLYLPTILMECELVERRMPATEPGSNFQDLEGFDGYVVSSTDVEVDDPEDFEVDVTTDL